MTTPQMDWLDDERRRWRNAGAPNYRNTTPWLPPARTDPRLETRSWRIAVDAFESEHVVYHGPGDLAFTYDDLRDALVDLGRYVVACNAMHRSMERRQVLS